MGYGMAKSEEQAREEERQGWEKKPGPADASCIPLSYQLIASSWVSILSFTASYSPIEPRASTGACLSTSRLVRAVR